MQESQLIARLIAKDEATFRQVVSQYHGGMRQLAYSFVGDKLADEVVQEAWFSAVKALPRFQQKSSLKTWLLTIVANEAKSRLRQEKRWVSLEQLNEDGPGIIERFDRFGQWKEPPLAAAPDAEIDSEQLEDCLKLAIAQLPTAQAAVLSLREQQALDLKDICNILDVSESNVRVLLHRARNRLFRVVEIFQGTGECCPIPEGN